MISAKVICDSVSEEGVRLTTFELEYPRITHSELLTHRMLSRNAASSRAIPFDKMQEQLTGVPVRFGAANAGMQDKGEEHVSAVRLGSARDAWDAAKASAQYWAKAFKEAGYHKQVYNRLTEPFQTMKTVVSATEWDNFFWLRNHSAADPTLEALAKAMHVAYNESIPKTLRDGEWHLPYVEVWYAGLDCGKPSYNIGIEGQGSVSLEEAIKVSCARCAAVSFRNADYGLEKCKEVYDRLVGSDRLHASALEHCATPMEACNSSFGSGCARNFPTIPWSWQKGISHMDKNGNLWSGNFKGWVQYRKTISGEHYTNP